VSEESQARSKLISDDRLNFIIAFCAILVSGASFYATFLQANSAEQQVKAMTWPLIEFTHGNYDVVSRVSNLSLTLRNAGVGPAIVKTVKFNYEGQTFRSLIEFIEACCADAYKTYMANVRAGDSEVNNWSMTTAQTDGIILPVAGQVEFLLMPQHVKNADLWKKINKERWKLNLEVCYCSLLENCYVTDRPGQVEDVDQCPE
jgi:hypothetical protein